MFHCQDKERFLPLLVEREKQEWFGLLISAEVRLYSKFELNYQQSIKGSSTSWLVKTEKSVVCSSSQCGYWGILGWYLVWVLPSSAQWGLYWPIWVCGCTGQPYVVQLASQCGVSCSSSVVQLALLVWCTVVRLALLLPNWSWQYPPPCTNLLPVPENNITNI